MASRPDDDDFARLVSLACHDLRTPLATVMGFVRTLPRFVEADERAVRYLELMDAAGQQLAGLLDDLSLAARIEGGRYDAAPREVDSLELARAAAERTDDGEVAVEGRGAAVVVDPETTERMLAHLARCALRHGGLERVLLAVDGATVGLTPIAADVAPIILGDDLRDLGAAVACRAIAAMDGAVEVADERLVVRLPAGSAGQ